MIDVKMTTREQFINAMFTDGIPIPYDDSEVKERLDEIESKEEYWNEKSEFSGNYNDLTNKPSIPAEYNDSELRGRIETIEGKESDWDNKSDFEPKKVTTEERIEAIEDVLLTILGGVDDE